ncbi:hypothetical protein [Butyrivibrio sp. NC2002]|uniref:hypothetical protein n=1 Tax=Butyrivibrio sp. NC2002 TaxID=1410610 RepID=UPI00056318A0|nr:hypothetical protein [Butyrivibrio sp. NC2002]
MRKLVQLIARKKWNPLSKFIAVFTMFFCFVGFLSLSTSYVTRDYQSVPAYISDITAHEVWRKQGPRTEYEYKVHWIYEGQEYTKQMSDIGDKPNEQLSEVWINSDNTDMVINNSFNLKKEGCLYLVVSVVLFVVWVVLLKKSKDREYVDLKRWERLFLGGCLLSVLSLIGTIYSFFILKSVKNSGSSDILFGSFIFGFFLIATMLIVAYTTEVKRQQRKTKY